MHWLSVFTLGVALGFSSWFAIKNVFAGSSDQAQNALYQSDLVAKVTTSSVGTSSSSLIVPRNPARRGFVIYNNSKHSVYLTYGSISTSDACTRILEGFTQFESLGPVIYTGEISAIRNGGNGTLTVTEIL